MFDFSGNIIDYFFDCIDRFGKYNILNEDGVIKIKPQYNQEFFKPTIIVKDLDKLSDALINYVFALRKFYTSNRNLKFYHNLSFFFNNLFFNMTSSDAEDLVKYINNRSYFFSNNHFDEFNCYKLLSKIYDTEFYVKRVLENPGLETPFVLEFKMKIDNLEYSLPLVRYAFDEENTCYLFAIQFGREREYNVQDIRYKQIINKINSGVSNFRNVSPSFVMTFRLFLNILKSYNVDKIRVPDFLYGRYKKYYHAESTYKSDQILSRILDNFILLMQRMEYQFPDFKIEYYPNEIDSYTHITLNIVEGEEKILKKYK